MKVQIHISLKNGVLDPQGKVVLNTLTNLGMTSLQNIRQGKFFEIDIETKDQLEGEKKVLNDLDLRLKDLEQNFKALVEALNKSRPASAKGVFMKRVAVSSTMGPGLRLDQASWSS